MEDFVIKGKYGEVVSKTTHIEEGAIGSLVNLMNQPFSEGKKFVVMPDVHDGKGCVIGFTGNFGKYAIPNIVGVDIGCGMLVVELGNINIDLPALDEFIKTNIPHGRNVNNSVQSNAADDFIDSLRCSSHLKDIAHICLSLGSLGGGNHFIEIDEDEHGKKYLIIHSGSRNLGKQVADYYQDLAYKTLYSTKGEVDEMIAKLKSEGRHKEISEAIKNFKPTISNLPPKELCYLTGSDQEDYIHDMKVTQLFARVNRSIMASKIINFLKDSNPNVETESWHCVHNYIGGDGITRKGAVSARNGEKVIIPISMKDGCILGVGKGNPDWNYSAPHGAGRTMSRRKAKDTINVDSFESTMAGIYTTTANQSTIDEHPSAYKPMEYILERLEETVGVIDIIKPIYNFKASE